MDEVHEKARGEHFATHFWEKNTRTTFVYSPFLPIKDIPFIINSDTHNVMENVDMM